jgi:uncharacterized protein
MKTRTAFFQLIFAISLASATIPSRADDLYQTMAVVSGRGEAHRQLGFAQCFEDVLVKVSGDPELIGDQRVTDMAKNAASVVEKFAYRDFYEGRPLHDEQGSYDRPHFLTVDFKPNKIDAILQSFGKKPWLGKRPRLVIFLAVKTKTAGFALAEDSSDARAEDMRTSLKNAIRRTGLDATLPASDSLFKSALSYPTLATAGMSAMDSAARSMGFDAALAGTLTWSDDIGSWVSQWRLSAAARTVQWGVSGTSFDDAFRSGVRGTAKVLSGNGSPH